MQKNIELLLYHKATNFIDSMTLMMADYHLIIADYIA